MDKKELKDELRKLCSKERNIYDICVQLKINEYEVLALVRELRNDGINIITKVYDDDLYLYIKDKIKNNYAWRYLWTTQQSFIIPVTICVIL